MSPCPTRCPNHPTQPETVWIYELQQRLTKTPKLVATTTKPNCWIQNRRTTISKYSAVIFVLYQNKPTEPRIFDWIFRTVWTCIFILTSELTGESANRPMSGRGIEFLVFLVFVEWLHWDWRVKLIMKKLGKWGKIRKIRKIRKMRKIRKIRKMRKIRKIGKIFIKQMYEHVQHYRQHVMS